MREIKCLVLQCCEALGLFCLTRWWFSGRLHILCYHGFQLEDECKFRPQLFISSETFAARLQHIADKGINVLELGDALSRLKAGALPARALVITVDDGFRSTLAISAPLLVRHRFPATVYQTTYYMEKRTPVFRLAVQYLFWKSAMSELAADEFRAIGISMPTNGIPVSAEDAMWAAISFGEALPSETERGDLLHRIAAALSVEIAPLIDRGLVSLMSEREVRELSALGFDVQLHTHRHRFPADSEETARREVEENRVRLEALTGRKAIDLCYPSGLYHPLQWEWLSSWGINSATTCVPGLNTAETPRYGLRRFLDSEAVRFIEFRAELAGFNELLRSIKRALSWHSGRESEMGHMAR